MACLLACLLACLFSATSGCAVSTEALRTPNMILSKHVRCALIRWKLKAVNSLIRMWQGACLLACLLACLFSATSGCAVSAEALRTPNMILSKHVRCALIRWKLKAVNSLIRMWQDGMFIGMFIQCYFWLRCFR